MKYSLKKFHSNKILRNYNNIIDSPLSPINNYIYKNSNSNSNKKSNNYNNDDNLNKMKKEIEIINSKDKRPNSVNLNFLNYNSSNNSYLCLINHYNFINNGDSSSTKKNENINIVDKENKENSRNLQEVSVPRLINFNKNNIYRKKEIQKSNNNSIDKNYLNINNDSLDSINNNININSKERNTINTSNMIMKLSTNFYIPQPLKHKTIDDNNYSSNNLNNFAIRKKNHPKSLFNFNVDFLLDKKNNNSYNKDQNTNSSKIYVNRKNSHENKTLKKNYSQVNMNRISLNPNYNKNEIISSPINNDNYENIIAFKSQSNFNKMADRYIKKTSTNKKKSLKIPLPTTTVKKITKRKIGNTIDLNPNNDILFVNKKIPFATSKDFYNIKGNNMSSTKKNLISDMSFNNDKYGIEVNKNLNLHKGDYSTINVDEKMNKIKVSHKNINSNFQLTLKKMNSYIILKPKNEYLLNNFGKFRNNNFKNNINSLNNNSNISNSVNNNTTISYTANIENKNHNSKQNNFVRLKKYSFESHNAPSNSFNRGIVSNNKYNNNTLNGKRDNNINRDDKRFFNKNSVGAYNKNNRAYLGNYSNHSNFSPSSSGHKLNYKCILKD